MSENDPNPRQTLAFLLGASSFDRAPKLAQGRAFYNSAQDFREYLLASKGLGLARENVKWLFDDTRSPSDQLRDISDFLETRTADLKNRRTPPQDLIVYYVGHGLFWGPDQAYCLAVRETGERNEGVTSIRVSDLGSVIKDHATFLRKFLILDCCFSAAAYREFQSSPLEAGRAKLLVALPQKGTALLCSASAQDPSLAPEALSRTMFSEGLLKALREGHPSLGSRLSVSELGDLVTVNLRDAYPNSWVRPEVHSPDQREGDVASVRLFPNPAYLAQEVESAGQKTEAGKPRRETKKRIKADAARNFQEDAVETRRSPEEVRAGRRIQTQQTAVQESQRVAKVARPHGESKARETARRIGKLIVIPSVIALAITILRLVGELQHWPRPWVSNTSSESAVIDIMWLPLIFGPYFARKLAAAGEGPSSNREAIGMSALGLLAIGLDELFFYAPVGTKLGTALFLLGSVLMLASAFIPRLGWRSLGNTLLAYAVAARIPVVVVMSIAMRGNSGQGWGTHYDEMPSALAELSFWGKFVYGFAPQMTSWIGFFVVLGGFVGSAFATLVPPRRRPTT